MSNILRNFECKKLTDPMIDNLKDENVLRTSIKACKYEISEATTSRDTVIGYLKSNFLMNIPIAILCIFIVIMIIKYNLKLYEKTDEKRPYLYFVGAVYIVFSMLFPNATLLGIIIGILCYLGKNKINNKIENDGELNDTKCYRRENPLHENGSLSSLSDSEDNGRVITNDNYVSAEVTNSRVCVNQIYETDL